MKTSEALCLQPGEIRLSEIQFQTDLVAEEGVRVTALDTDGHPVLLRLRTTEKWSTRGWHLMLQCPGCAGPCRVLRHGPGGFRCRACQPPTSTQNRCKNSRYWREQGGRETAAIAVALTGSKSASATQSQAMRRLIQLHQGIGLEVVAWTGASLSELARAGSRQPGNKV